MSLTQSLKMFPHVETDRQTEAARQQQKGHGAGREPEDDSLVSGWGWFWFGSRLGDGVTQQGGRFQVGGDGGVSKVRVKQAGVLAPLLSDLIQWNKHWTTVKQTLNNSETNTEPQWNKHWTTVKQKLNFSETLNSETKTAPVKHSTSVKHTQQQWNKQWNTLNNSETNPEQQWNKHSTTMADKYLAWEMPLQKIHETIKTIQEREKKRWGLSGEDRSLRLTQQKQVVSKSKKVKKVKSRWRSGAFYLPQESEFDTG